MPTLPKGHLIALEGPDGVGKTTLARGLQFALQAQGLPVLLTREPGGTEAGQAIRRLVLGEGGGGLTPLAELLLFAADRAQHVAEVIRPAILNGHIVICDRWHLSTWAYQAVGRGLPTNTVADACLLAADGLDADVTLILKGSPEDLAARRAARGEAIDRMERAGRGFHSRIAEAYSLAGAMAPSTLLGGKVMGIQTDGKTPSQVLLEASRCLAPLVAEWCPRP